MQKLRQYTQRGFTLIEVMIVVVILAILAAMVLPKLMSRPAQAKRVAAKNDILSMENALSLYKLDNGFYPSTAQGLKALRNKPGTSPVPKNYAPGGYINKLPIDPWGNPYHYVNNSGKYVITSYGADGKLGGSGDNADISSASINKN